MIVTINEECRVSVIPCDMKLESLQELVGGNIEIVRPRGLFELRYNLRISEELVMIIDEEGRVKDKKINPIGSFLYKSHQHGEPIVGPCLIVGTRWTKDGIDICELEQDTAILLAKQFKHFAGFMMI